MSFRLDVRQWELDFTVNTTWSNKCRIEGFNPVCGHDNLYIASRVETVELVEKF
jgi:hypothetical protein